MHAITCEKCYRRFTPTVEEARVYLAAAQGKKHALVLCPHCGKHNKVSPERLKQAVRFVAAEPVSTVTAPAEAEPAAAPAAETPTPEQPAPEEATAVLAEEATAPIGETCAAAESEAPAGG
jgi:DNA-directed RNA polymerase subunit M/transcription elongation factor TFIIS